MKSIFQDALTLSVHLMLCAVFVCVALLSTGVPAEAVAVPAHQQAVLLQAGATTQSPQESTPSAPANALASITADLAGDLPELLLATPLPLAASTLFDRQVRHPSHALPHPFPKRPQRPPRLTPRHA